ncbi:cupin domain-containing protein [Rhizobium leguminosarum]|uniref:cupin domain-containing protein n=1 Tax=Rhizobium leguminosarum TaxID=384 RepID=UPI001C95BCC1|nr:cupin domain-containing protein [Rhizobium leguminosarum]
MEAEMGTGKVPNALKTDHRNASARRVVTGVDSEGRSTIVSDGDVPTRFVGEAYTVNQVWQAGTLPTPALAENTLREGAGFVSPAAGYTYVITTFPPDSSWDYERQYTKSLMDWGAGDALQPGDAPGMHTTDSVDIVTVISGEIWAVLETGETLLKPGDTLIQRGTKHAWKNRSDADCTISAVHVTAIRPSIA